jgi:hypothetical protein
MLRERRLPCGIGLATEVSQPTAGEFEMKTKLMLLAAALALTAAPSLASAAYGTLRAYENSYVNPDGAYPSFWAYDREL